jgi:hypothetical protein
MLITNESGIADNKSNRGERLPSPNSSASGSSHGQDNKSDTYKGAELSWCILKSRISRYICGKTKALCGSPYAGGNQEATPYSNIRAKNAQRPKTTVINTSQPWDRTASVITIGMITRRRSLHSSHTYQAKEGKQESLLQKVAISGITKEVVDLNPNQGSKAKLSVGMWAQAEVNKCLNYNTYTGLIKILSNPTFL